jgi:tetratricopeptide (TPR) repeat protein
MKNDRQLYLSIYKTLSVLLILFTVYTAVIPKSVSAQNSSASKVEVANQNFFAERFREGRELIDRQEWAQAAAKFRDAVEKYPDNKSADAAFYWLAFCYKKQKKYREADAVLGRLLVTFPSSTWASDARVMKTEIAPWIGRLGVLGNDNINSKVSQGQFSSDLQAKVITETVNGSVQNPKLADKLGMGDRLPLDRADEIRIAAFQSLLTADPQRAIETTSEVFKSDSKASENLKLSILRVWRNQRLFASQTVAASVAQNPVAKEFAAMLREALFKSFQNDTNLKIRNEIIYTLADFDDEQSTDYLKKLYAAANESEIKKAIINSFGSSAKVFYPLKPGQNQSADLIRQQTSKIELDFLLEIVRNEKDTELRQLAFSILRRFPNWSESGQAAETMTNLYDEVTGEEFKILLIQALAESKQTPATRKLLDIAKNDTSDKLRLEAIYSLRNSKDPQIIKFLQDLIK